MDKLQKAMWFEWTMQPASNNYNNVIILKLKYPIKLNQLQAKLTYIHGLYPVLSTLYREDKSFATDTNPITIKTCKSVALLKLYLSMPYQLINHVLYRYAQVIIDGDFYLGFSWHHILLDAYSVELIFATLYQLLNDNSEITQKATSNQLPAAATRDWLLAKFAPQADCITTWQNRLRDIKPFTIGQPITTPLSVGRRILLTINSALTKQIMSTTGALQTTLFNVIAAAIVKSLSQLYGVANQIMIGVTENIRDRSMMQQLGNYVALLPLIIATHNDFDKTVKDIQHYLAWNRAYNNLLLSDIFKLYRELHSMPLKKLFNVAINAGTYSNLLIPHVTAKTIVNEEFHLDNSLIIRFELIHQEGPVGNTSWPYILFEIDFCPAAMSESEINTLFSQIKTCLYHSTSQRIF